MKTTTRSISRIVEDQVNRWHVMSTEKKQESALMPVITISRQPGSGGNIVAERVATLLNYDLVLNTGSLSTDQAAEAICGLVKSRTA